MMIRMVGGWVFLLVPDHPGSPGQRAVKRLLLLFGFLDILIGTILFVLWYICGFLCTVSWFPWALLSVPVHTIVCKRLVTKMTYRVLTEFVCSFVTAGRSPAYFGPQHLRPFVCRPNVLAQEGMTSVCECMPKIIAAALYWHLSRSSDLYWVTCLYVQVSEVNPRANFRYHIDVERPPDMRSYASQRVN